MKIDHDNLDTATPCARIQRILRDCRIAHLSAEELARVRLFYTHAGVHAADELPLRSVPRSCDPAVAAVPLSRTA